jgi:hypothetical protein
MKGDIEKIGKLPVLSLIPVMSLFYATYGAESVKFADSYVEYNFSPQSLGMTKKLVDDFLKPIDH